MVASTEGLDRLEGMEPEGTKVSPQADFLLRGWHEAYTGTTESFQRALAGKQGPR